MTLRILLLCSTLALMFAGCGGGDDSATPTDETYTTGDEDEIEDDPPEPTYEDPQ
ncbi:MAG: hypothetical protein AAGE52_04000 [Myxococcota bacterium]